jgi:hypothetical protein
VPGPAEGAELEGGVDDDPEGDAGGERAGDEKQDGEHV